jgi:hypothetical protein
LGVVRRPDEAAEELHDADGLAAEQDREGDGSTAAQPGRDRRPPEVGGLRDIRNPGGFGTLPDASLEARAREANGLSADGIELRGLQMRCVPEACTSEDSGVAIDIPERAPLPRQPLPNGLQQVGAAAARLTDSANTRVMVY